MAVLKTLVKTLSGTSAQALGTIVIPVGALIYIDSGTVYIGGTDLNSSTNGFKLLTTPITLGNFEAVGEAEGIDLSHVYVQGGAGNEVVRILYFHEATLT